MRRSQTLIITNSFSHLAEPMRAHFESRFARPHEARGDRFVWDYWHIPNQYTALRTPAYTYFPQKLYRAFHNQLVWWGRRTLGCHDISPPWMSCYIEGCRQEVHSDVPHGPWAFVFSLTPWRTRTFRGGETFLMRENVLSYWRSPESHRGLESDQVFDLVPAQFNRLTVFDPRIPHGVRRVEGVHDPRDGRLVIHGWFVQPRPFTEGALSKSALQRCINDLNAPLNALFERGVFVHGMMSIAFHVTPRGEVSDFRILSNSLRGETLGALDPVRVVQTVRKFFRTYNFGNQRGRSHVTLPLNFELGPA